MSAEENSSTTTLGYGDMQPLGLAKVFVLCYYFSIKTLSIHFAKFVLIKNYYNSYS